MKPMREERRKLISTKKEEEEEDGKGVPEIQQTWADYNIIPLFVSEQKKNESTPVVSQKIFKISLSSFFWQKPIFANSKSLFPLLERAPALNFPAPPSVAWSITGEDSRRKKRRVWAQKSGKLEQEKRFFLEKVTKLSIWAKYL